MADLTVLELCAGGGGQAVGLEQAGFQHAAAVEIDPHACSTLRMNRPHWAVIEADIRAIAGKQFAGVDLLAAGVPCPPFSIAGRQLGADDERDLFPEALRLVGEARPRAVLLENVRGLATARFDAYRHEVFRKLNQMGYRPFWRVLNASDYGVPQLRPRFVLVALREPYSEHFRWPRPVDKPLTVAQAIGDLMAANGWQGVSGWMENAHSVAPTLVGGSKKHGGPDLGPTRAREAWKVLGVDGAGLADAAPGPDFPMDGLPRLTVRMAARIQGFPDDWQFSGGKTSAYRQVGNAFPPPVARAVGLCIAAILNGEDVGIPMQEQPSLALDYSLADRCSDRYGHRPLEDQR